MSEENNPQEIEFTMPEENNPQEIEFTMPEENNPQEIEFTTSEENNPPKKSRKTLMIVLSALLVLGGTGFFFINHYLNKIQHIDNDKIIAYTQDEALEDTELNDKGEDGEEQQTAEDGAKLDETMDYVENADGDLVTAGKKKNPYKGLKPEEIDWSYHTKYTGNDARREDYNKLNAKIDHIDTSNLVNILLLGQDGEKSKINGFHRADVTILCSINTKTGEVSLVSFLRDTYLKIPGYKSNRINVGYRWGGFPLEYKIFKQNFGLDIDGGFCVTFESFQKIMEILGGVDLELTAKEATVLGVGAENRKYHLAPDKALAYARTRQIDNDASRSGRQRKLLMAIFNKVKGSSTSELNQLLKEFLPLMATDMSNGEIMSLAGKLIPKFSSLSINTYQIPSGSPGYDAMFKWAWVGEMYVVMPDLEKCHEALLEYLPL